MNRNLFVIKENLVPFIQGMTILVTLIQGHLEKVMLSIPLGDQDYV